MKPVSFEHKHEESKIGAEKLEFVALIQAIPGCVRVEVASDEDDRSGVDYWAILEKGGRIGIDSKRRDKGCSRYWKNGPEITLEIWSVEPINGKGGKPGWTWDETKTTDYVLFVFDPSDTKNFYLLPFHLLRSAFMNNYRTWKKTYEPQEQPSNFDDGKKWVSVHMFLPVELVCNAVAQEFQNTFD